MKKTVFAFLTTLIPFTLSALPVGNPSDASLLCDGIFCEGQCNEYCEPCQSWCDAWSVRVGFYGDYVFDKHMQVDTLDSSATIHETELFTNAAYLAFNMCDRVDVFGTLGATNIRLITPRQTFGSTNDNEYVTIETDTYFSWSIGARGTIWECGCLALGGEVQYFQTRPDINFIKSENDAPDYRQSGDHLKYFEWQLGLGLSYRVNIACSTALVPYIALKWGHAKITMDNISSDLADVPRLFNLENDQDWGYAVGVTLVGCNKASVTVEGRFADERAVYVNSQFRF